MGDILCISRNKNTENTDSLPNASVLGMNKDAKINSTKKKQNPSSPSDGTIKRLIYAKKKKSRKKDKHIGPRPQEKRVKRRVEKKGSTDKTTNPTSSNKAALNETKKQLARENKSNKNLKDRGDNKVNNEDSTQSFSTVRSLSRSNDIEAGEIGENQKRNGTVVETDRDPNVDSNDESIDGGDNERRTYEEDDNDEDDTDEDDTDEEDTDEEDTDEDDTEENDTDEDDTDEDGTDEDDTDELDIEEDDGNASSVDRDTQESDNTASMKRKQFKGISSKKLNLTDNVTNNNSPNKSPLKPDPSQRTNDRKKNTVKPALMYNIKTGMTMKSIKELLLPYNKTSSDSTIEQNDFTDLIDSRGRQTDPNGSVDFMYPIGSADFIYPIDSTGKQMDPTDSTSKQTDPIDSASKQTDHIRSASKQTDPIDLTSKQTDHIDLTSKQTDPIDSTEKQTRPIEKNIVPALAEETCETQLTGTTKDETLFNKKYPSV